MSAPEDSFRDLLEILRDVPAFTFSINCVSGLVGCDVCQCWRCTGVEPKDENPGWRRAAQLITEGHRAELSRWLQENKNGT